MKRNLLLQVVDIDKSFNGIHALRGINIGISRDCNMGILGSNGAGKTTLFNVISGFCKPDKGEVSFEEECTTGFSPLQIAQLGIIRVFQDSHLFNNLTVWENVLIGCLGRYSKAIAAAGTQVTELLRKVDLWDKRHERVSRLPFGQRRLVEVARAIAANPKLLMLDEAAAGLSDSEQYLLEELLKPKVLTGMRILAIDHCVRFLLSICDTIIILSEGTKLYEGASNAAATEAAILALY